MNVLDFGWNKIENESQERGGELREKKDEYLRLGWKEGRKER